MLKFLAWLNRYGCWCLMALALLFVFSGLDMTKHLLNPGLAKRIHTDILPIPFYILLLAHIFFPLRNRLLRWSIFKNEKTATLYAYAVCGILLVCLLWLQLR